MKRVRAHVAAVGVLWAAVSAVAVVVALRAPVLPPVASREGLVSDAAFTVLLVLAMPVFVLVQVTLAYSVVRFRARAGDGDGPPIARSAGVEWTWVVGSLVLVLALAAYGWRGLDEMRAAAAAPGHGAHAATAALASGDLRVRVIGSQFAWAFEYPDLGVRSIELRVPKGRVVRFEITSTDVLHSFWIPAFRMKQDAIPGRTVSIAVTPTQTGHFPSSCAALCGAGHTIMRSPVEVMEPEAFDAWAAQQRAAGMP